MDIDTKQYWQSTLLASRSLLPTTEKVSHPARRSRFTATSADRRKLLLATCVILSTVSLLATIIYTLWTFQPSSRDVWSLDASLHIFENSTPFSRLCSSITSSNTVTTDTNSWDDHPLNSKNYLLGTPTESFKDNLRNDTKYISSWTAAGWTNDVMAFGNLIYLAMITGRVPILPRFTASRVHVIGTGLVGPIPVEDVFDVPRLSKAIGIPILQWQEVKDVNSSYLDDMGCWSVWDAVTTEDKPRHSQVPEWIGADISYTRAPPWIKYEPHNPHDRHARFWDLAALSFPETRHLNLVAPRPSPERGLYLPPDDHLLCFDYVYYVCAHRPHEFDQEYSPAWRNVLQHMHWTERLVGITDDHIRQALDVQEGQATPPWIAVHIRRRDFQLMCGEVPIEDCYASLPVYERRVREVQKELLERKGVDVQHVIMTSDEKDPSWWEDVAALGWHRIDFEAARTKQRYGTWYPVLIDAVIQSHGVGFVGTAMSTMSLMAQRRVETWHDGVVRTVQWGRPGADDH